ncbi:putative C-terminal protein carboxyl methyltransferase [Kockovaella imperatae]|uniref:Leucine carboxyl methyltransferase 1 n=1 Tax=Kockovaella imperatae TaxID=4999 RepID=A0A1Y1U777_9TREE|nr:putative C-terminal protein carboxyl methyltransferase [Kockovaella imperatae]ORX33858.1 putative C-terminal protein carboxyl methyltransferase [Kockovaella imperatae]
MSSDQAVRGTDDDAASMRISAVNQGYLKDTFAPIFHPPSTPSAAAGPSSPRKPPLINIGTHHRTYAIDLLIDRFFTSCGDAGGQVVSLGAGSDTRYFRYMERPHPPHIRKYIEVDFAASTAHKIKQITGSPRRLPFLVHRNITPDIELRSSASSHPDAANASPTSLISPIYTLLPLDLRHASPKELNDLLLPYLDTKVPTLFLAECVFCYLPPKINETLIKCFGQTFEKCSGIIYEMLGSRDSFGQVMRRNLASRNLDIPGADPFPDLSSESKRFTDPALGEGAFSASGAKSLWDIRKSVIDKEELSRIGKLEMLDEIEELKLVLSHYVIAWGSKGEGMDALHL